MNKRYVMCGGVVVIFLAVAGLVIKLLFLSQTGSAKNQAALLSVPRIKAGMEIDTRDKFNKVFTDTNLIRALYDAVKSHKSVPPPSVRHRCGSNSSVNRAECAKAVRSLMNSHLKYIKSHPLPETGEAEFSLAAVRLVFELIAGDEPADLANVLKTSTVRTFMGRFTDKSNVNIWEFVGRNLTAKGFTELLADPVPAITEARKVMSNHKSVLQFLGITWEQLVVLVHLLKDLDLEETFTSKTLTLPDLKKTGLFIDEGLSKICSDLNLTDSSLNLNSPAFLELDRVADVLGRMADEPFTLAEKIASIGVGLQPKILTRLVRRLGHHQHEMFGILTEQTVFVFVEELVGQFGVPVKSLPSSCQSAAIDSEKMCTDALSEQLKRKDTEILKVSEYLKYLNVGGQTFEPESQSPSMQELLAEKLPHRWSQYPEHMWDSLTVSPDTPAQAVLAPDRVACRHALQRLQNATSDIVPLAHRAFSIPDPHDGLQDYPYLINAVKRVLRFIAKAPFRHLSTAADFELLGRLIALAWKNNLNPQLRFSLATASAILSKPAGPSPAWVAHVRKGMEESGISNIPTAQPQTVLHATPSDYEVLGKAVDKTMGRIVSVNAGIGIKLVRIGEARSFAALFHALKKNWENLNGWKVQEGKQGSILNSDDYKKSLLQRLQSLEDPDNLEREIMESLQ